MPSGLTEQPSPYIAPSTLKRLLYLWIEINFLKVIERIWKWLPISFPKFVYFIQGFLLEYQNILNSVYFFYLYEVMSIDPSKFQVHTLNTRRWIYFVIGSIHVKGNLKDYSGELLWERNISFMFHYKFVVNDAQDNRTYLQWLEVCRPIQIRRKKKIVRVTC